MKRRSELHLSLLQEKENEASERKRIDLRPHWSHGSHQTPSLSFRLLFTFVFRHFVDQLPLHSNSTTLYQPTANSRKCKISLRFIFCLILCRVFLFIFWMHALTTRSIRQYTSKSYEHETESTEKTTERRNKNVVTSTEKGEEEEGEIKSKCVVGFGDSAFVCRCVYQKNKIENWNKTKQTKNWSTRLSLRTQNANEWVKREGKRTKHSNIWRSIINQAFFLLSFFFYLLESNRTVFNVV